MKKALFLNLAIIILSCNSIAAAPAVKGDTVHFVEFITGDKNNGETHFTFKHQDGPNWAFAVKGGPYPDCIEKK